MYKATRETFFKIASLVFEAMERSIVIALASLIVSPAYGQVTSEMRLFSDSFVSSSFAATERTDYQFFGVHLKSDEHQDQPVFLDISGAVAFGAPLLNYLNISEIYFTQKLATDQSLTVGRRKFLWSDLDTRWNLGLWEPVFRWNPLLPSRQGLSGLFWEVERPGFQVMIFASPFFLPDQGPSYEIQQGEFVRGNPWFRRPPETLRIFGENTAIEYTVQRPDEADIVLQSSYGGSLRLGQQQGLSSQFSYIYKPANQLGLAYDGTLDLAADKGAVEVLPHIYYHSLASADLKYQTQNWRLGASVSYDRPSKEQNLEAPWTYPVFSDALLASAFLEVDIGSWQVTFQHLEVQGGEVSEAGDLADPQRRPLSTRYTFRQAEQIAVKTSVHFPKNRRLDSQLAYAFSAEDGFALVRASAQATLSRLWAFYGEVQLVKLEKDMLEVQSEIAQYANNDRFMLGVSYVF